NVTVTVVTGSGCTWTVSNPCANWLTVSPTSGTGNGQVTLVASANNTGSTRTCSVNVAGSSLSIGQAGGSSGDLLITSFGFVGGKFGFNVTGPAGKGVVIEVSADLQSWTAVQTNTFGAAPLYFSDPQPGTSADRFYRARLE